MSQQVEEAAGLLDEQQVLNLLSEEGPFAMAWKGFEPREQQLSMMRDIVHAYNERKIALIEAGTGTGKSLAYLIPALLWAKETSKRVLISTNTINLQEQLLHKDLPMIGKILGIDFKAVLAKGMGNYLCLRRLEEATRQQHLFPTEQQGEIEHLEDWARTAKEGCRSSLPMMVKGESWEQVKAESDACTGKRCPHYKDCFFFKARQEAENADIIVANHHLLFADLSVRQMTRNFDDGALIPGYRYLILDEAHNVEDVATEHFATHIGHMEIMKQLGRLRTERSGQVTGGSLDALRKRLLNAVKDSRYPTVEEILQHISVDLAAEQRSLTTTIHETFQLLYSFVAHFNPSSESGSELKLRLRQAHLDNPLWKDEVAKSLEQLQIRLKNFSTLLHGLEKKIEYMDEPSILEACRGSLIDVQAVANRLDSFATGLLAFMTDKEDPQKVGWIEVTPRKATINTTLIIADLDIAEPLVDTLFRQMATTILCSATLATNKNFHFIRQRLGLTPPFIAQERLLESIYESPFDYPKQSMMVIPNDLPLPTAPHFLQAVVESIWEAVAASHGNAFVLFTSYGMLRSCYQLLEERFAQRKIPLFRQGDKQRRVLLEEFRNTDRSVLFGTDSFWEGVDVAGEALRCVILVKLPFQVPSEPLVQARSEAISARGGNPFLEYTVPNAIVKFKQGFGRLIRHKKDRGCIVCLDPRLIHKPYGRLFFNSLPPSEVKIVGSKELYGSMQQFYRKTYHLIKQ